MVEPLHEFLACLNSCRTCPRPPLAPALPSLLSAFVALTRRSISSLSMLTSPSASPLPSPADACPCSGSPGDPCSRCCGTRSPQLASDPAHRMQMDRFVGVSVMHAGQMIRPDSSGMYFSARRWKSQADSSDHFDIPGGRSCSQARWGPWRSRHRTERYPWACDLVEDSPGHLQNRTSRSNGSNNLKLDPPRFNQQAFPAVLVGLVPSAGHLRERNGPVNHQQPRCVDHASVAEETVDAEREDDADGAKVGQLSAQDTLVSIIPRCKGIEEHLSSSSSVASWSKTFFDDTNHVCYLSDIW